MATVLFIGIQTTPTNKEATKYLDMAIGAVMPTILNGRQMEWQTLFGSIVFMHLLRLTAIKTYTFLVM